MPAIHDEVIHAKPCRNVFLRFQRSQADQLKHSNGLRADDVSLTCQVDALPASFHCRPTTSGVFQRSCSRKAICAALGGEPHVDDPFLDDGAAVAGPGAGHALPIASIPAGASICNIPTHVRSTSALEHRLGELVADGPGR